MNKVYEKAYAKVNLGLKVGKKDSMDITILKH